MMIEGTKPYRPRGNGEKKSESSTTEPVEAARTVPASEAAASADAANKEAVASASTPNDSPQTTPSGERALGRREWFRSLVPALGGGLVEILRASNNLERDLKDLAKGE